MHVINLDPAADEFQYSADLDIKELVSVDEVMQQMGLGPNGALIYCMEFLLQNVDWLKDAIEEYSDDDYIILDCPGQVELYSHLNLMHMLAKQLTMAGYRCVSVYLLDALFVLEPSKFISGCLLSLSSMMQLALPHINVITKCDLADKAEVERVLEADSSWLINSTQRSAPPKFKKLTEALSGFIDDYMMVSFVLLDITDEDSIEEVMAHCDHCIQYGEDAEVREMREVDEDDEGNHGSSRNRDEASFGDTEDFER